MANTITPRMRRIRELELRIARRRRIARVPVMRLRDRSNPFETLDALEFKRRFHIFKETAQFVINVIKDDLSSPVKRGVYIPPLLQFLMVLRFYADGSFQLTTSDLYNTTQGTISKVVKRVSSAIAKHRKLFIKYPSFHEASMIRAGMYRIADGPDSRGFPGVVGVIDGTHIPIVSPGGNEAELFRNRKRIFSINVQAVCDHEMNFTNLVARWYGSAHDARIFENSRLCGGLENGTMPGLLLGDAGYACTPYLMTPLANPITAPQRRYNRSQIKTRNIIERTFGVWKRRFPCLNHLRLKLRTTLIVIVATAILHNISRRRNDIFDDDLIDLNNDQNNDPIAPPTGTGRVKMNEIIATHFS